MADEQVMLTWKPEEVFELSGKELELFLNFCNASLNNPEAQRLIALYEIKKLLDEKIRKGTEDGKVVKTKTPN